MKIEYAKVDTWRCLICKSTYHDYSLAVMCAIRCRQERDNFMEIHYAQIYPIRVATPQRGTVKPPEGGAK